MSTYINITTLKSIDNNVINYLHTANNIQIIQQQVSSSFMSVPGTSGITIPIFSAVSSTNFPFSKYSYNDLHNNSATSAVQPVTMELSAFDGTTFSASNLSNNECNIYAIANGVLNQLEKDNRLVSYDQTYTSAFRWHVDNLTRAVYFDYNLASATQFVQIPLTIQNNGIINAINVLYEDITKPNVWHNADFYIDYNQFSVYIIFPNKYNYIPLAVSAIQQPIFSAGLVGSLITMVMLKPTIVGYVQPIPNIITLQQETFNIKVTYFYS